MPTAKRKPGAKKMVASEPEPEPEPEPVVGVICTPPALFPAIASVRTHSYCSIVCPHLELTCIRLAVRQLQQEQKMENSEEEAWDTYLMRILPWVALWYTLGYQIPNEFPDLHPNIKGEFDV